LRWDNPSLFLHGKIQYPFALSIFLYGMIISSSCSPPSDATAVRASRQGTAQDLWHPHLLPQLDGRPRSSCSMQVEAQILSSTILVLCSKYYDFCKQFVRYTVMLIFLFLLHTQVELNK
jgi:hypothetical protein